MKAILLLLVAVAALLILGFLYRSRVSKNPLNVERHAGQEIEKATGR